MVKRRSAFAAFLLLGCANIWGFEDLEAAPPPPPPVYCAGSVEPCPEGCSACSARCVDLATDVTNCGTCGTQCTGGRACKSGRCICEAGAESCSGVCANLQSDIANCGGCGIACDPGGACNQGTCTFPITLSTGQGTPGPIVVDGSRIYFVGGGSSIYSMAKDGSDLVTLGIPAIVYSLALDAENLYTGGTTIDKIPLATGTPETLTTVTASTMALAVDATSVYFSSSGTVNKVPILGGTPAVLTTGSVDGSTLDVEPDGVYFSYSYDVYRTPLTGGSSSRIGSATTTVQDLEVDAGIVYMAAGGILALSLSEGTLETLATVPSPRLLAVDAENVYFFDSTTLSRVSRTGGDVAILALDSTPGDLALDDTNVYWTSRGADGLGAVMTIAK